jgi:hypothetical protein
VKTPHAADPQVPVQNTPALRGSFVTIAASEVVVFTLNELGTGDSAPNATEIGTGNTVSVIVLVSDGWLVTVAVIVTVLPIGTAEGAVNIVASPSPVCAGVRVPHAPFLMLPVSGLPPQRTVQSTPARARSPVGIILKLIFDPIERALA